MANLSRVVYGRQSLAQPLGGDFAGPTLPVISDQSWETLTGGGWTYTQSAATNPAVIVSDGSAPHSPTNVLVIDITGVPSGSKAGVHERQIGSISAPTREFSAEFWFKLSANFETGPALACWLTQVWPASGAYAFLGLYCMGAGCPDAPSDTPLRIGGDRFDATGVPRYPNVNTTTIARGEWHKIRQYYKFETAEESSGDGIWRVWVDDVLNIEHTDVTYPVAMGGYFLFFDLAITKNNDTVTPHDVRIDHTLLSGQ
jgi:hypothetical protein